MSQKPVKSVLFVSRIKIGAGLKMSPASGTGIVTLEADGGGTGTFPVNTAITTAGAGVLSAAGIVGQQITRSGPTGAFSDATASAAAIVAAIPNAEVGQSFFVNIKNTTAFAETITAGGGITLSGFTIVPANSTLVALVTLTTLTAVAILGASIVPNNANQPVFNTNISTAGAGTLTGAAIAGGQITRSGAPAAFSDATDTAAAIVAAIPNAAAGMSFYLVLDNTTAFPETITAAGGITLSGFTIVPANSTARFLVTLTSLAAVAIQGVSVASNIVVPGVQYDTLNATVGTLAAGKITGAAFTVLLSTNATPGAQTTRTAAQMLADIPGARVGFSYVLRILNSGAGVFTLTGDSSVTVTGTPTIAQHVYEDFAVTFTSSTTATIQSIGSGVQP